MVIILILIVLIIIRMISFGDGGSKTHLERSQNAANALVSPKFVQNDTAGDDPTAHGAY